jgi:hypothetical protein
MDVRWFLAKGYVREFERRSDSRNGAAAAVCSSCRVKRSEFVLTDTGAEFARLVLSGSGDQPANRRAKPVWTRGSRRLCFQGRLVKAFKQPAGNQAKILAAFQEEGWPHHIYDPLPPRADLDAPERLRATVKRLNRHQQHELLRFECDGRGEGIVWRPRD